MGLFAKIGPEYWACCCDNAGSRILGFTGFLGGGMEFVGLFVGIGPEYWGCCCDNGRSRILGFTGLLGGVNGSLWDCLQKSAPNIG
ncbi:MAG: hypothetical protein AAFV78_18505, partial [Bacteroidota bacterium]